MDIRDIKLPTSVIIGSIIGFTIGFIIGVVSGGFILEIIARSILSGLILGGTLFGVEQLIRRFAPEILEETPAQQNRVNIKEEDEMSIEDLYNTPYENEYNNSYENKTSPTTEEELDTYLNSSMDFSENNVFNNEIQHKSEPEEILEDISPSETIEEFKPLEFEKISETKRTYFEPTTFSTAELGVTRQSRGGTTENFIITGKGKPIPKDYKKLAEAIRTKLKEE